MARISKASNLKIQERYGSSWRPTPEQLGLGAAGLGSLGALGYLAYNYPTQTTKLAQKGLSGLVSGAPIFASKLSQGQNIGKFMGEKILSNFLPFGVNIK
jgi:hypothetical protein